MRLSILLVVVLLIFGGAFLVVRLTGSEATPDDRPWLYRMDEGSIVHIAVSHGGKTVNYDRQPGSGDWYIQGNDQEEPDILVFNQKFGGTPLLVSGPKVSRVLKAKINNPASYGLEPPQTLVQVTDRGGNMVEFHMGGATPDSEQQYASLVGNPALFTVPKAWADVVNKLALEPPYLRLFQLNDDTLVFFEVSYQGQTASYEKASGTGEWFISGDTKVAVFPEQWGEAQKLLSGPRVEKRVAMSFDNPAQYGLEPPAAKVRVAPAGLPMVEFHLGDATEDGRYLYARVAGEPELFAMSKSQAQRIFDLATKPPYPPGQEGENPGSG